MLVECEDLISNAVARHDLSNESVFPRFNQSITIAKHGKL